MIQMTQTGSGAMGKLPEFRNEMPMAYDNEKAVATKQNSTTHGNFSAQFFPLAENYGRALTNALRTLDFAIKSEKRLCISSVGQLFKLVSLVV